MKLRCYWNERMLARMAVEGRTIPSGSPLATHLAYCADCRHAWEDFVQLASELPIALLDRQAPPAFTMPLLSMKRAQNGPSRISLTTLALASLLLAAVVGGRLASPTTVTADAPAFQATAALAADQTVAYISDRLKPVLCEQKRPPATQFMVTPAPQNHPYGAPETALPALASLEDTPITQANSSIALPPIVTSETWGELGAWYAANGNYSCAAVAYGRAYDAQPDPDFALAAGQSAESAGELNDALTYYLHVLETTAAPQSHPEEDELWNETLATLSSELCSL